MPPIPVTRPRRVRGRGPGRAPGARHPEGVRPERGARGAARGQEPRAVPDHDGRPRDEHTGPVRRRALPHHRRGARVDGNRPGARTRSARGCGWRQRQRQRAEFGPAQPIPPVPARLRQVGAGQPFGFPAGQLDHVDVGAGRCRCRAVEPRPVAQGEVLDEQPDSDVVGQDVVQDNEEQVVLGAEAVEPHAHRWLRSQRQPLVCQPRALAQALVEPRRVHDLHRRRAPTGSARRHPTGTPCAARHAGRADRSRRPPARSDPAVRAGVTRHRDCRCRRRGSARSPRASAALWSAGRAGPGRAGGRRAARSGRRAG